MKKGVNNTNKLILFLIIFSLLLSLNGLAANSEKENVFAQDRIEQRALDISKQVEIYINANLDKTLDDKKEIQHFKKLQYNKLEIQVILI